MKTKAKAIVVIETALPKDEVVRKLRDVAMGRPWPIGKASVPIMKGHVSSDRFNLQSGMLGMTATEVRGRIEVIGDVTRLTVVGDPVEDMLARWFGGVILGFICIVIIGIGSFSRDGSIVTFIVFTTLVIGALVVLMKWRKRSYPRLLHGEVATIAKLIDGHFVNG